MKRLPLIPTVLVAAAVATMIGLGVWQLQRRAWKEDLIARYQAAAVLPPVAWPNLPPADDSLLYRQAQGFCTAVTGWRAVAGRNARGESGWSHIAACGSGAEGPGMQADMGWSKDADPPSWTGGTVTGVIAPDSRHRIRLVATQPAPGLQPSARPDPSATPNNHLFYAIQWFFFAAAAAIIYMLALRRRQTPPPPPSQSSPRI
ncbi:SURF1 family protein [Allosphingosinicella flava]|uniref:SURF1-like protein n=1 Tax=Allosphingosinicella flava TaxID=2771430 RepID=A0A7T2GI95_9SPHN|nr:SURF1 family cytochrome oxidase biogenesis protein [Sphingosinicella flava]QPQ54390.1 SURF1 family protein [Sphingosinicella flava]